MKQAFTMLTFAAALLVVGSARAEAVSASSGNSAPIDPPRREVTVDNDGTVHIPPSALPLSIYMSDEAKKEYIRQRLSPDPHFPKDLAGQRAVLDREHYDPLLKKARAAYDVTVNDAHLAGVRVDVVTPKQPLRHANRVLICLHGGSMMFGAGKGGLLEAIPIAATARIKVVSVDYRQLPEFHFPAASEDVAAVYRVLLKQYRPKNIGIYGCSAGGDLAAMSVAWFQKEGLPRPGAIGIFCASADYKVAGDSSFTAVPLIQDPGARSLPPPPEPNPPDDGPDEYLHGADPTGPLVAPALHPDVLAKFPPTLIITGTRDVEMSSAVNTHARLVKAGVDAELHVWDGMWHSFYVDVDLPESREAYAVTAQFFETHLGRMGTATGHPL